MGRINTYPNATRLERNDELLIDGPSGTRNVLMSDAAIEIAGMISPTMHKNIFRGKNLGSVYTDAQKEAIRNGTFDDLYIGDYWDKDRSIWRIADIDYWLNSGDGSCNDHHLVIMPDAKITDSNMNDTNTTDGGYIGSKFHTGQTLENVKITINNAFGSSYVLNHREYLTNGVTNGKPSGGVWVDSTVELPNEIMMYGCSIFSPTSDGQIIPAIYTIDKNQLALMRLSSFFINPYRQNIWLRDVVSASYFAGVSLNGNATSYGASHVLGVRPVFGIHG